MRSKWLLWANGIVLLGYLILIPFQISSCNKRVAMIREMEKDLKDRETPTPTPCISKYPSGWQWVEEQKCFSDENKANAYAAKIFKKMPTDTCEKIYEPSIDARDASWCVNYKVFVDRNHRNKYVVVLLLPEVEHRVRYRKCVTQTVSAITPYYAIIEANQQAYKNFEPTWPEDLDAKTLSIKEVK